jgi:DnaJ-class molecular chaperone
LALPVGEGKTNRETRQEMAVNYTHYDYLDLAPGASTARIEAAYAQVLQRFQFGRTDTGQDLSGLVRMIHAAYRVLSDPDARRAYDEQLAREAAVADAELKAELDAQAQRPARHSQDVPAALRLVLNQLAA